MSEFYAVFDNGVSVKQAYSYKEDIDDMSIDSRHVYTIHGWNEIPAQTGRDNELYNCGEGE